ncbi:hypothetical protein Trisim1_010188 [Trichoderma cf. simile WF8]
MWTLSKPKSVLASSPSLKQRPKSGLAAALCRLKVTRSERQKHGEDSHIFR